MDNRRNTTIFILGFLAVFSLLTVFVLADSDVPYPVRYIENLSSSRANISNTSDTTQEVAAGNVTEINLTTISTTKTWAGFYGNITGVLTLEDVYGYVFYNWTANEPKGEIYASPNNTILWQGVTCFEFDGSEGNFDIEEAELRFGIQDDDEDGINETFTDDTNTEFRVGSVTITANTCPATNTYTYGQQKVDGDWENVLLTDDDALIFATLIENDQADNATDKIGFDNRPHDFQLMVAENGHDGYEDTMTTYYFWAEIE
ncbi:hypothetical protein JW756_05855 [Candidatus Woesearchaeota archaeon]|nr:hypothetical protein [Candidatus Woesearchaeota archaeon]